MLDLLMGWSNWQKLCKCWSRRNFARFLCNFYNFQKMFLSDRKVCKRGTKNSIRLCIIFGNNSEACLFWLLCGNRNYYPFLMRILNFPLSVTEVAVDGKWKGSARHVYFDAEIVLNRIFLPPFYPLCFENDSAHFTRFALHYAEIVLCSASVIPIISGGGKYSPYTSIHFKLHLLSSS